MLKNKRLHRLLNRPNWSQIRGPALMTALGIFLLFWRLNSLTGGISLEEKSTIMTSRRIADLSMDPAYFAYKLPLKLIDVLHPGQAVYYRAISALLGLLTILMLGYVLRQWYSKRAAVLGSLLLLTSSWFLTYSRIATRDIASISLVSALLFFVVWQPKNNSPKLKTLVGVILLLCLVYTPGLAWLVVIGLVSRARNISQFARQSKVMTVVAVLGSAVLLLPLLSLLSKSGNNLSNFFGLHPNALHHVISYWDSFVGITNKLFGSGESDATFGLTGVPLLNFFEAIMLVIGIFAIFKTNSRDAARTIITIGVVLTVLVSLNGPVRISAMIPIVFVLMTGGINHMLQLWSTVFPRNPIAKSVGMILMSFVVAFSCTYHVTRYFVAWPRSRDTKTAYSHQV